MGCLQPKEKNSSQQNQENQKKNQIYEKLKNSHNIHQVINQELTPQNSEFNYPSINENYNEQRIPSLIENERLHLKDQIQEYQYPDQNYGSFQEFNVQQYENQSQVQSSQRNIVDPFREGIYEVQKSYIFGQDKQQKNFLFEVNKGERVNILDKIKGMNMLNYSGVTIMNRNWIIVCGGIQFDLRNISKKCYILNIEDFVAVETTPMNEIRYTFPVIKKQHYYYAIGGRVYGQDHESILNKCERFDSITSKWETIADMNINRCTSTAFVYKNEIWVFGGYTGKFKRSRKIEKYIESENRWEMIPFKLYKGFENGNVVPSLQPNKIIILGGKLNFGHSSNVWEYDLQKGTVLNKRPLLKNGILTKYFKISPTEIMIVGEQQKNTNNYEIYKEIYDIQKWETKIQGKSVVMSSHLDKFKQYNFNHQSVVVDYKENENNLRTKNYEDFNIVFGTDEEPYQLEIDSKQFSIEIQPIQTNLKLMNFQGCCRINSNEVFFAGGINIQFKKITERSFIYNLQTKEIKKIPNMINLRYTFSLIKFKEYIYAIGGRQYGDDKQAILNKCERYSLLENRWEQTFDLNHARCTSNAYIFQNKLYVAGGFGQTSKRIDSIEVFDEEKKKWKAIGIKLYLPIEASIFIPQRDRIYYFGGRQESKGDTGFIFTFCHEKQDLEEVEIVQSKASGSNNIKTVCLHKCVKVGDHYAVFGNYKEYVDFISSKEFLVPNQQSDDLIKFKLKFQNIQSKVTFNNDFFKKNSYILPSEK